MGHQLRKFSPGWPSYQGLSHLIGRTIRYGAAIYYDPSLGVEARSNAAGLMHQADRIIRANNLIFGTPSGHVDVIVFALNGQTDGSGGADHMACNYAAGGQLECCATFTSGNPGPRLAALFEAELSECSMKGNLCGMSTGEALSRWLAAHVSGNALADFATAPSWQQDGQPDFVNVTDPTDQNPHSTGCGMAFLSWLLKAGHSLESIARWLVQMGADGTWAGLYNSLSGQPADQAWPLFQAAVGKLPPILTDDPFGAGF